MKKIAWKRITSHRILFGTAMAFISLLALCFSAFPAYAATTAPAIKEFSVGGGIIAGASLTPVASQQEYYAHTLGATSFKVPAGLLKPASVRYFTVTGQNTGGSYQYVYNLSVTHGVQLAAVELATDLQKHTQLIAVGTPTAALTNSSTQGGIARKQSTAAPNKVHPNDSNNGGHFRTDWWDPVGIHVNEVLDDINFNYNGQRVTYYSGSDYRWWLSNDGWFEAAHNINSYYSGNNAVVTTYDHMQNNPFCIGNYTHVYYNRNNVIAHGNGSVSGNVNTSDSGTCGFLLHYTTSVG